TLCGWMAASAELLTPLFDLMVKRVLLSIVIHTDDTRMPVWDPTLPQTRTGRFWVSIGDVRHPYVVYDSTPRRTRDGPEQFLKGFRGYLQADAFSGYDRMCAGPDVIEVACWAHAADGLRGVVDRAGPPRAAQEPDRPGDRLYAVELGGALSLPRARGAEHRQ
ncbi:MAG: transposase, partial [Planctomycetaceae bacterium]|nr:transposase [Planctomycetaceae bacterium]